MVRATTPTHIFTVPFDPAQMRTMLLTYSQRRGRAILERGRDELTFGKDENGYFISTKLTQAETARFSPELPANIQLRVVNQEGEAMASNIIVVPVEDVLNAEVLT